MAVNKVLLEKQTSATLTFDCLIDSKKVNQFRATIIPTSNNLIVVVRSALGLKLLKIKKAPIPMTAMNIL